MKKDLLSINDLSKKEIEQIFRLTDRLKNKYTTDLKNKVLAMIFEKSSTRTRVSFEVAMQQLGGHAIFLSKNDIQLGRGEPISDTAKVLSRYVDGIMARLFKHEDLLELAKHSSVPIINGLTDFEHPCQALADLYTIKQKKKTLKGLKIVFLGDGANNTFHSLILACEKFGMNIVVSCHHNYQPKIKASYRTIENPEEAIKDADIIYLDVFVSMGQESEKEKRLQDLLKYQLDSKLVKLAKKDVIVMHPMPVYRGIEVTKDVIDSNNSIMLTEAENRLHVQKGLLYYLLR